MTEDMSIVDLKAECASCSLKLEGDYCGDCDVAKELKKCGEW